MKGSTFLALGRASNLPTVWTNVLCGAVLASSDPETLSAPQVGVPMLVGSLFYVGGMFLNDYFDAEWDRQHRADRPIARGEVTRSTVGACALALFAVGMAVLVAYCWVTLDRFEPVLVALGLALAIGVYDRWHKGVAVAPIVMGACRAGTYLLGAVCATPEPHSSALWAAVASLGFVMGLTHLARFETGTRVERLWLAAALFAPSGVALGLLGSNADAALMAIPLLVAQAVWIGSAIRSIRRGGKAIGNAIAKLIAALAVVDATFLAVVASPLGTAFAVGAFALTLLAQRRIKAT
jgi:4-hydroxybenzoate polyprenyltransferase